MPLKWADSMIFDIGLIETLYLLVKWSEYVNIVAVNELIVDKEVT